MRRWAAIVLLCILLLWGCGAPAGELEVHVIDVGQADCMLLRCGGQTLLLDGGNVEDSRLVVSYLLEHGVEELDYVVNTHPHEDHVGGLDGVLAVFPVGAVYGTTTTYASQCYDTFLHYVDQQGLTLQRPEVGAQLSLGDAMVTFLGPCRTYAETNNTSLVLRVDYGETSFLFTGDMEQDAEADLLASGVCLEADVLKVGHHGSSTSTSEDFLDAVHPQYGIISCGAGNSYGHPHAETLSRLEQANVQLYRTDQCGTVVITSDGRQLSFRTERQATEAEGTYIGNRNSKKLHLPTCTGLPEPQNRVVFDDYEQALQAGYTPCSRCMG